MTHLIKVASAVVAALAMSAHAAQPNHSPAGLTGLWETETAVDLLHGTLAGGSAGAPGPATAAGAPPPLELALFRRVKLWGRPPYNAEWEAKTRQAAGPPGPGGVQDLVKGCGPGGFPGVMENPTPDGLFQVVITAAETLIITPNGDVRQIYTDGRKHPASDDLWPTLLGDSIGSWRGKTLVVDTIARKAGPIAPVPIPGMANLSDQAHFTERLRLLDADTLQNDMTIDDPPRFAHPWQVVIRYKRVTDVDRLMVTDCTENDRDTVVNDKLTIAPP